MPATLIYDGKCPFCVRSARRLQRIAGQHRLNIVPIEAPGTMELHPNLDHARALKAVQLVLENGRLCEGAEAAFQALALRPLLAPLKVAYYFPPLRLLADLAYALIAKNRHRCETCA